MTISMREGYGRALAEYGAVNPDVVVLDADTSSSTLSNLFAARFPDRFFNIGIAEPCMIDVAAGMALEGLIPFANAFAALMAVRALEQIHTNIGYARTNVKLVSGYAGVSDFKDGATHHAITDIANLRAIPGMTIVVAADAWEAGQWVPIIAEYDGPVYFRISRAAAAPVHTGVLPNLRIGKGLTLRAGNDVCLLATGAMAARSLQAADQLAAEGVHARVLELHTVKPLDCDLILQAAEETRAIVTVEEHSILGGLGGAVAELLAEAHPTPMLRVGIRDAFTRTALDCESLMDAMGLGVADVVRAAESLLAGKTQKGN
jgi:transketolase